MWFLAYLIPRGHKGAFCALFKLSLVMTGVALWLLVGTGLQTKEAQYGQFSIQFAWAKEDATRIMNSWEDSKVFDNLRVDNFILIPSYTTLIGLLCLWAGDKMEKHPSKYGRENGRRFTVLGRWFAWTQTLAGIFDLAENLSIGHMVSGVEDPWPMITVILAAIKWFLIGAGILFFLAGICAAGFERSAEDKPVQSTQSA